VVVGPLPDSSLVVTTQDLRYLLKECERDEWFVLAGVSNAVPLDDPDIERVGQHPGDLARSGRLAASGSWRGKSLRRHRRLQLRYRVVAGCIEAKHLLNEKGAPRIGHYFGC